MGFSTEFNWFIVLKGDLSQPNVDETRTHVKSGYRIYPISSPESTFELPLILNGVCIGMGTVIMQVHANDETHIKYRMTKVFGKDDSTGLFFTEQYKAKLDKEG